MDQDTPRQTGHAANRGRTSSFSSRSDESVKKVSIGGATSLAATRRISIASHHSSHMQTSLKKIRMNEEAASSDARRRNVKYENTYRLEPKVKFPVIKVRKIIKDVLSTLNGHTYDPKESSFVSKLLSKRILDEVRLLNIERYKLVCLMSIGSKSRQGLRIASRCLWNTENDTFVSETLDTQSFYAIATVYATYYE
ncbi:tctex1 domain-containing protein 1-like [Actinia tenebrosa]|uniref:Tctex1 domain-containing protein 1-like n=1 Tax=Actinia tenebrosa TaxID=6105 RepID=A0A6P8IPG0_ACTTE|nr:tctex1 domain-containing protein 1-like [Actinia tenebrosa]